MDSNDENDLTNLFHDFSPSASTLNVCTAILFGHLDISIMNKILTAFLPSHYRLSTQYSVLFVNGNVTVIMSSVIYLLTLPNQALLFN